MNNNDFMQLALESAKEGIKQGDGGPFGACIVCNDEAIAVAHNTVLRDNDPTCHAEMNAIRQASKELVTYDLSNCIIYATSEPCPMCRAAIYWSGMKKIVFGADKLVAAHYGFNDEEFYIQMQLPMEDRKVTERNGCCRKEVENLFEQWQATGLPVY